jgi:dTMP kinase
MAPVQKRSEQVGNKGMAEAPFIVLEGIDGAGTTTQAQRLVSALRARAVQTHATREPSDGPIGTFLRQVLTGRVSMPESGESPRWATLALLFSADRLDHLNAEVLPRLARGECVVSDRYDHSTVAYQSAFARDAATIPWLRELNRFARRPTLTLVLDVSPAEARRRRLARAGAQELFDDDDLQARLAAFYEQIDTHFPRENIVHIGADGSPDAVAAAIWTHVLPLVEARSSAREQNSEGR